MRIDRLEVENFRGFLKANLEFKPGFNLIVGENGSGKTSVLEALAVGIGSWLLGIRGYDSKHIAAEDVRVVLNRYGDTTRLDPQWPAVVRCTGYVLGETSLVWMRSLESRGGRTTQREAKKIKELAAAAEERVRKGEPITLPIISYYGTKRLHVQPNDLAVDEDVRTGEFEERFAGYYYSIDQRIDVAALLRWLRLEAFIAIKERRDRDAYSAVKKAILGCVNGCTGVDYDVATSSLIVEIEQQGKLPFHHLSDGQRTMLAMVADIAFKATQLNPHLGDKAPQQTPGVVLIDEIDLHLHPRWQRNVVRGLKASFPEMQFIVTTHSPQIIGETPHDEIMILKADGTWERPNQSIGLSSNQVLKNIMGTDEMNQEKLKEFSAIFRQVEEGDFEGARETIARIRRDESDFPELVEASAYMDSIDLAAG